MDYFGYHARSLGKTMDALDTCPTFGWSDGTQNFNIRIIPGTVRLKKDLQIGGFRMEADLMFHLNVSDLPQNNQPTLKQTISYLGRPYEINVIGVQPGGLTLEYQLIDLNQGV